MFISRLIALAKISSILVVARSYCISAIYNTRPIHIAGNFSYVYQMSSISSSLSSHYYEINTCFNNTFNTCKHLSMGMEEEKAEKAMLISLGLLWSNSAFLGICCVNLLKIGVSSYTNSLLEAHRTYNYLKHLHQPFN